MDTIEYKEVIKYLLWKGNTPLQIKDELNAVYGDSAPSIPTVNFWAAEFKRDRISLGDDERSRRPKIETNDNKIAQVHQMVLDNRQIKMKEIAKAMNMSKERVCHILSQDLGLQRVSGTFQTTFVRNLKEKATSDREVSDSEQPEHKQTNHDAITDVEPNRPFDNFQQISDLWMIKLRKMQPLQQILVEKFFNDILLEGQLGTLHRHSMQLNAKRSARPNSPVDASADNASAFEEIAEEECSNSSSSDFMMK